MKHRVWTAAVAMPLVLGAVFCAKHSPLVCLALGCFWLGWAEFRRMVPASRWAGFLGGVAGTALIVFGAFVPLGRVASAAFGWITLGLCVVGAVAALCAAKGRAESPNSLAASLWIGAPLAAALALHAGGLAPAGGEWWNLRSPLLLLLLPLWAGDTAAIFIGKAFGRVLLAPSVSPRKTVEGAIANLAACLLLGWAAGVWLRHEPIVGLSCGLTCGVLGQGGDLFESHLKRLVGVKDSGSVLPGHGGLLDRIDSLLFSAPPVLVLLAYFR